MEKSTNEWINGDVTVTLSHSDIPTGYMLQYKVGDGTWTEGTTATVTINNTTVLGRLYNVTLGDEIASNSVTVSNIDKEDPTAPTGITSSVTTNSITVTATGGTDSPSGVAGYQYSKDNSNWSATVASGTSYSFSSLSAATSYTIYVRTVDKVGRISSNYSKSMQTSSIKVTGITLANKTLTKTSTTNPTVTITPTITPSNATNKGVTWSSSNTGVATVSSSGVVTWKKIGTATITATAKDGSGVKGTCTVSCRTQDTNTYSLELSKNYTSSTAGWKYSTRDVTIDVTGVSKVQFQAKYWDSGRGLEEGKVQLLKNSVSFVEKNITRQQLYYVFV